MRWLAVVAMVGCTDASRGRAGADARVDAEARADADGDAAVDAEARAEADGEERPIHLPWVALWLLDQPAHALYESTYYRLNEDGSVDIGPSEPPDCSGHLSEHCVTGSVAPSQEAELGCVFGTRWWSPAPQRLAFEGVCTDGVARDIVLVMSGGGGGFVPTVESVGGEAGWIHDNWEWRFMQCPSDTDTSRPFCCEFPETCAR